MHLLKSKAKPTATDRQRKKIPLKGSFGQYLDSKRKADAENFVLNIPGVIQQKKGAQGGKQIKDAKMGDQ